MKRVLLFLATNLAVIITASIVLRLLGVESYLQGSGLNLTSLLIFAAIFGFAGSFISLAMSKWIAKMTTGAQVIDQPQNQTEQWLMEMVTRQAREAGIGMPEVAIYDSPDINAFATGMSRDNSLVAVSTGLLSQMTQDEVEAVLAHEVSHVANGDMVTMALIQGILNTFVIFFARIVAHLIDSVFRNDEGEEGLGIFGYLIVVTILEMIFGILASIISSAFSRHREYRADAGGARLAGADKMIAALRRLQSAHEQAQLPSQLAAFGINGGQGSVVQMLFSTHPSLDSRIAALEAGAR